MSTFESSHKSLLMGVSQQVPEERLPGQVTAQLNMLSDPVTNLRRRPGLRIRHHFEWVGAADGKVIGWFTDVAGVRCHVLLNISTGAIIIKDEAYGVIGELSGGDYLIADSMYDIRAATVGNEFFIANIKKSPKLVYPVGSDRNQNSGFAYIVSGAFGKLFTVSVTGYDSDGDPTWTVSGSKTTPGGTEAGDATKATPEAIATTIKTELDTAITDNVLATGLTVARVGAYLFATYSSPGSTTTSISVTVNSGTVYMISSKGGFVNSTGELPARLPTTGDGYVCRIGSGKSPQYFKYSASRTEWLETGDVSSPTSIKNVPISIYYNGSEFAIEDSAFEGRTSGDDESNPTHEFMRYGITGLGTYQGRLVILSGPLVSLSASKEPRRFFRSTVTSVIASDPIETGSSLNSSASYEYALPFQKDLLLFSKAYQAVLPSGNAIVSPNTATVVPTSAHEVDTLSSPINLGRTLMFAAPRSDTFFGAMEMIPSPYTDSQYISQEATPHLPKYMPGRSRFAVSSSVSNLAMFGPSGDTQSVVVHEYAWDGDQKIQQAWHTWTFPYPVSTAYFASERIVTLMVRNGVVIISEIDTKAGAVASDETRRPRLDLYYPVTVADNTATVPDWLLKFDPSIGPRLKLAVLNGPLAGEFAGMEVSGSTITTVVSHDAGEYAIGIPYRSSFSPTPPVIRDYNEVAMQTTKATVLRYIVGTRNSGMFNARVSDLYTVVAQEYEYSPLEYSSPELAPGRALIASHSSNVVPARTDMKSTLLEIYTEGSGELNLTSLEYIAKYNQKIRRR